MKFIIRILLVTNLFIIMNSPVLLSEEWIQYTNGDYIQAFASEGDFHWVGTNAGLVKINKKTNETTFFNKANSKIPGNNVLSLAIDKNGDKWIGTNLGLAKYDNINWFTYHTNNSDLPDNIVTSIIIDSNSNKWIGTYSGGLAKFDGTIWTVYNNQNTTMPINSIASIYLDKAGIIWICPSLFRDMISENMVGTGLVKYDQTNWVLYNKSNSGLPDNKVLTSYIDKHNNQWFGTYDSGLVKYDNVKWQVYNESNTGLRLHKVSSILAEKNGDLWIGTDWGLMKYDSVNWTFFDTTNSNLPKWTINILAIEENGDKWLAATPGLIKFDGTNGVRYKTSNSGFPIWDETCVIDFDKNGDKWIGTQYGGLLKFDGKNWELYNANNSIFKRNDIRSMVMDRLGVKWFGNSYAGLVKFDGINWFLYDSLNSPLAKRDDFVGSIVVDSIGNKWITTKREIFKFDDKIWTVYNSTNSVLKGDYVRSIIVDKNGVKWISTERQLIKFDDINWTAYSLPPDVFNPGSLPTIILTDIDKNNNIWFSSWTAGIGYFNGTGWTVYSTKNSDLPHKEVRALALDKNDILWIGFNGDGIARFDQNDWTIFNESNSGIPSNSIFSIDIDDKNNIWIGTAHGIGVLLAEQTSVEENNPKPQEQIFIDAIPNPFTNETELSFQLSNPGIAKLILSDLLGNEIAVLRNEFYDSGLHKVKFNADNYVLSSGTYFCSITVNGITESKKLVFLK